MKTPVLLGWLLMTAAAGGGPLGPPDWVEMESRPTAVDLDCAGYDLKFWSVTLQGDRPVVVESRHPRRIDPLPFDVPKHEDRSGDRHVFKVPDGWLVGFDAGEFGGGLWFTTQGSSWRRVSPEPGASSHPEDIYRAENVLGIVEVAREPWILMGLDHLGGRSGRVFKAVRASRGWALRPVAVLDSSPNAWVASAGVLEVVTEGGLWQVSLDKGTRLVVPIDFGMALPQSLLHVGNRRYVGLRRYVLVLEETPGGWAERWYGPKGCLHSSRDERFQCRCGQ